MGPWESFDAKKKNLIFLGQYQLCPIVLPEVKTPNFGKVGRLRHCCQLFKWDYNESLHLKNSLISTLKKRRDYLRSKVLPIKMPEGRRRRILPFGCCFVGKEWVTTCMKRLLPQKSFHTFPFFFCSNTFDYPKHCKNNNFSFWQKRECTFWNLLG